MDKEYILKFKDPQITIQEDSKEEFKKLMNWNEEEFMSHVFVRLKAEKPKEFSKNQLNDIEKIQNILLNFKCNEEVKLDNSERCPFNIGCCSHKSSEGCLHYKLYNILKKHGRI